MRAGWEAEAKGDSRPVLIEWTAAKETKSADFFPYSNEKFVVPICCAMGFAYVLRHTGCDQHLVQLLVKPVRRVRILLLPGTVLIGVAGRQTVDELVFGQPGDLVLLGWHTLSGLNFRLDPVTGQLVDAGPAPAAAAA